VINSFENIKTIVSAIILENCGGTALPIILYWSPLEPKNSKSSSKVCILPASRTVIVRAWFGSGCICLKPSLYR